MIKKAVNKNSLPLKSIFSFFGSHVVRESNETSLDKNSFSMVSFTQCMNIKEKNYETNGFFVF